MQTIVLIERNYARHMYDEVLAFVWRLTYLVRDAIIF